MRCDQRLEREGEEVLRRRARSAARPAAVLVLAFAFAAVRAHAAERPDVHYPEMAPSLPEPEPSPAVPAAPPTIAPPTALRLLWFDPKDVFPPAFDIASREVRRIFRDVGVDLRFERGNAGVDFGDGTTLDIPVILLGQDPMRSRASQNVMGLVPRPSDGTRVVWIFLSPVSLTLGYDPRSPRVTPRQANELGLALARVVAHEVVHAIIPDEPHASSGLMHHSMDRSFLLGQKARIDRDCARAFARNLAEILGTSVPPAAARMGAGSAPGASAP
jgi:hypothetical protein